MWTTTLPGLLQTKNHIFSHVLGPPNLFRRIMRMHSLLLLFLLAVLSCYAQVVHLDVESFDIYLSTEHLVLVSFYAPWCSHCKVLSKTLTIVESQLKLQEVPAKLAIFDATDEINQEVTEREDIVGYPTLVLYKYGQRVSEYVGQRTVNDIFDFMKTKSDPAAKQINSLLEIESFIQRLEQNKYDGNQILSIGLGCFSSLNTTSNGALNMFLKVASQQDMTTFFTTDSVEICSYYGVSEGEDSVVIFTTDNDHNHNLIIPLRLNPVRVSGRLQPDVNENITSDTPTTDVDTAASTTADPPRATDHNISELVNVQYDDAGILTEESLSRILYEESMPTILQYSADIQPIISQLPVKGHVMIFYNASEASHYDFVQRVESLCGKYKRKLVFIEVESEEYQILDFFNIRSAHSPEVLQTATSTSTSTMEVLPAVVIADMSDIHDLRKFSLRDYLKVQSTHFRGSVVDSSKINSENKDDSDSTDRDIVLHASVDDVDRFLSHYLTNKASLPPALLSEEASVVTDLNRNMEVTGVEHIVSSNFKEKVFDQPGVDSFVYIYAPWCAHCKSIEPIISAIGRVYSDDPRVNVFRIDGTKNDIPAVTVTVGGGVKYSSPTVDAVADDVKVVNTTEDVVQNVDTVTEVTVHGESIAIPAAETESEPKTEEIELTAEQQESTETVTITSSLKIKGYPSMFFYRSSAPGVPIEYDGERTVEAIVVFIESFRSL